MVSVTSTLFRTPLETAMEAAESEELGSSCSGKEAAKPTMPTSSHSMRPPQFRSSYSSSSVDRAHLTIPSPPELDMTTTAQDDSLLASDGGSQYTHQNGSTSAPSPVTPTSPRLHLDTHFNRHQKTPDFSDPIPIMGRRSSSRHRPPSRDSHFSGSPSSVASSSFNGYGGDIPRMTPLPSPIVRGESPGPWNRFRSRSFSRPLSRGSSLHKKSDSVFVTITGESIANHIASQASRKQYQSLFMSAPEPEGSAGIHQDVAAKLKGAHEPSKVGIDGERMLSAVKENEENRTTPTTPHFPVSQMQREEFLPPKSQRKSSSLTSIEQSPGRLVSSSSSISSVEGSSPDSKLIKREHLEDFEAIDYPSGASRRWRGLKVIGTGSMSRVILATSEELPEQKIKGQELALDPKQLVAVKIVEGGAAGGVSKERVESALKRELEILQKLRHPSLVRLRGYNITVGRALIVLSYYAGGDLFEFSNNNDMSIHLIRRIFGEVVLSLNYLHTQNICHRDVKLENILLTLPADRLLAIEDYYNYPHSLCVLSDLGLAKQFDPANPSLQTRCGSDDYASPELIMAQPYDGRESDAWALGVTLYALLEKRLPFDVPVDPSRPSHDINARPKIAHRIASVKWQWYSLKEEKEEDAELWNAAKEIVSGLIQRARKRTKISVLAENEFVTGVVPAELTEAEIV